MKRVLVAFPLVLVSAMAFSWGGTGHQLVAAVAWQKLDRKTKIAIANILVHGDVSTGRSSRNLTLPPADYAGMTEAELDAQVEPMFMQGALWMDDMKGGKSQSFDDLVDSLNAASPGIGDVHGNEAKRCASWHYVDLPVVMAAPGGESTVKAGDVKEHPYPASNADYALNKIIFPNLKPVPADAPSGANKAAVWLFMTEHIIGDLHQPLHATSLFNESLPNGDAGGNLFTFNGGRLHGYWDHGVDDAIQNDADLHGEKDLVKVAAIWLSKPDNLPTEAKAKDLTPMDWLKESQDLAIKWVYNGINSGDQPTPAYTANYNRVCKQQAILAGYRLAAVLKKHLGS